VNTSSQSESSAHESANPDGDGVRRIMEVLATIPDPEMPISITDLGLVERVEVSEDGCVAIDILPTMIGCPALAMIRDDIEKKIADIDGVQQVLVRFINDPPWSVDRISQSGREELRKFGVTVPGKDDSRPVDGPVELRTTAPPKADREVSCPFCGSKNTRLDSPFGPTRCRMIYFCEECENTFERMKRI